MQGGLSANHIFHHSYQIIIFTAAVVLVVLFHYREMRRPPIQETGGGSIFFCEIMILLQLSDVNLAKYFEKCMFTFFPLILYIEFVNRFPISNNCLSMTGRGRNTLGGGNK